MFVLDKNDYPQRIGATITAAPTLAPKYELAILSRLPSSMSDNDAAHITLEENPVVKILNMRHTATVYKLLEKLETRTPHKIDVMGPTRKKKLPAKHIRQLTTDLVNKYTKNANDSGRICHNLCTYYSISIYQFLNQ